MKISLMHNPMMTSAFVCASLVLASTSTYAQTVIDENYEALSVGAEDPVWTENSSFNWAATTGVVDDASDVFGTGNTRYLEFDNTGVLASSDKTFTNSTDLVYVGFDFILNTGHFEMGLSLGESGVSSTSFVDARFRGDSTTFGASLSNEIAFQGTGAPTAENITAGTHFRLEFVLNSDTVARSYAGVGTITTDQTIAAGTYDIFLRNIATSTTTQVGNDIAQNGAGSFDQIKWTNYSNRTVNFGVDNVNVSLIPEPSSFAFLASFLVCFAALGLRRRR